MTPRLTDQTALARYRKRAGACPELQVAVRDELLERLGAVKKEFTKPAIVTAFPEVWRGATPDALVVDTADTLALAPEAHDLVIHAMALHWADDPVGQVIQCRRALAPDGLFLAATAGGETLAELRTVLAEAETATRGGLSPRVAPMAEIRNLGALLQRAGLALPVADTETTTLTYGSLTHLMRDIRTMGETNALASRDRCMTPRCLFTQAAQIYRDHYPAEGGKIRATLDIVYLTGWAPDASQPQPLRPGSATTRLADVLGAPETPSPD